MLFVAEIGLCHNGNFDLACEMMRQAKNSGADIVKMQLGWRANAGEMNFIDEEIMKKLFKYADFLETEIMFSICSNDAYSMIKKFPINRYKVASRTLRDNINLVNEIVNSGKETIVSLGMWDGKELPYNNDNVKYLWCKSSYPSMPWDLKDFPKEFDKKVYYGYSDHALGISTALLAISRGAKIIEKHFTLDKSDTTIRDHVLSATPEEFHTMVSLGREIERHLRYWL